MIMKAKIGIIHTTSATISSLDKLVKEKIDGVEMIHFLDDSILGDMKERHNVDFVRERWISYAGTPPGFGPPPILWKSWGWMRSYRRALR